MADFTLRQEIQARKDWIGPMLRPNAEDACERIITCHIIVLGEEVRGRTLCLNTRSEALTILMARTR